MIKVLIAGGRVGFYQWDINQKMTVEGDCTEIHFANQSSTEAIVRTVTDGVVNVPDSLLQEPYNIAVYAYDTDHTLYQSVISVYPRPKPDDYATTDDEVEKWSALDIRVTALEGATPEVDPDDIAEAVETYMTENPIDAVTESGMQTYVTEQIGGALNGTY